MVDFWIPQTSSGEIVDIALLEAAVVQRADARWKLLKGRRRFPSDPGGVLEQVALQCPVAAGVGGRRRL